MKAKQMKLRPHGTDTIDSRVCQQSLTEGRTSQHGEKSPKLLQMENKMEQEDSAGRTRFQNSSRAGAEARHPGAAAEVEPDTDGMEGLAGTDGMEGLAGDVHACTPSAQEAETG